MNGTFINVAILQCLFLAIKINKAFSLWKSFQHLSQRIPKLKGITLRIKIERFLNQSMVKIVGANWKGIILDDENSLINWFVLMWRCIKRISQCC